MSFLDGKLDHHPQPPLQALPTAQRNACPSADASADGFNRLAPESTAVWPPVRIGPDRKSDHRKPWIQDANIQHDGDYPRFVALNVNRVKKCRKPNDNQCATSSEILWPLHGCLSVLRNDSVFLCECCFRAESPR